MTDVNTDVNNVINSIINNTGKHMGDLVTWSVTGQHDRATIDQLLIDIGINTATDQRMSIPAVSPINAFKRAIRDLLTVRGLKQTYTLEKIKANRDSIQYAVVSKSIVATTGLINDPTLEIAVDRDVTFSTEMWIQFNSGAYYSGAVPASKLAKTSHPGHPLMQRFVELYTSFCDVYTTDDVRTGFQRMFENAGGMRFSAHGGLFWIPSPSASLVRMWKQFMEVTQNQAIIIPMFDTSETIDALQRQTTESLEGQLAQIFEDLEKFTGKTDTRKSTLQGRIEAFDSLISRAELYESLLGHNLQALKSSVESARNELVASLNSVESVSGFASDTE